GRTGWPASAGSLAAGLPAGELLALEARCDSALAWAMVAGRLRAGAPAAEALAGVITDLTGHGITGRFNFLLTDGQAISATAAGDTLCYPAARPAGPGVVGASAPGDDEPGGPGGPATADRRAPAGAVEGPPLPVAPPPPAGPDEGRIRAS